MWAQWWFSVPEQDIHCCILGLSPLPSKLWTEFFIWLNSSQTELKCHLLGEALPAPSSKQNSFPFLCSLQTGWTTEIISWGWYRGCVVAFQGAQSTSEEHTFFFAVSHIPLLLHKTGHRCMCPHLHVLLGMYYRTTLGEAGAFIMTPL